MQNNNSKLNTTLLVFLIILVGIGMWMMYQKKAEENKVVEQNTTVVLGSPEDLVSFSISAGQKVSGRVHATGVIQGGYFFEGNLPIAILDLNKKPTSYGPGHGQSTTDWMTGGPVSFEADFDFSAVPNGSYYIRLMQDDPSGGEGGRPIRFVLIPIVVENTTTIGSTYTYKNHGFTMEVPTGFVPKEIQGETGPTWSIELPGGGWLIYITDATWWEKYNITGQTDYIREQKIGTTTFKVYRYTGQTGEFYFFRQGNVAYMFNGNVLEYMKTFKFVGWN